MMINIYLYKCFACIKRIKKAFAFFVFICSCSFSSIAQFPPNIDFELGNFTGWQCWVGSVAVSGGQNTITWAPPNTPVPPTFNRHTMLRALPGSGFDYYGGFPRNCPNGSGNSIQLGNDSVQNRAEGVSYTFTIPAGQNTFNLTYFYAIVLHEGNHTPLQQARLNITVENLTDSTLLPCQLDPFIVGTTLQGFLPSGVPPRPPAVSRL